MSVRKELKEFHKNSRIFDEKTQQTGCRLLHLDPKKAVGKKAWLKVQLFLAKSRSNRHQLIKYNDKAIGTKSRYEIFQIRN